MIRSFLPATLITLAMGFYYLIGGADLVSFGAAAYFSHFTIIIQHSIDPKSYK